MYYPRKKVEIDVAMEKTTIWYCSDDNCGVWMRDNFTFSIAPVCMKCQSVMIKKEKELGALENNSPIMTVRK